MFGFNGVHGWNYRFSEIPVETRVGVQGRYDNIRNGVQDTFQRNAFDTPRNDYIKQGNISLWTDTTLRWTPWLRTTLGVRFDYFRASVNSIQTPFGAPIILGDHHEEEEHHDDDHHDEPAAVTGGGFCFASAAPCFAWTGPFNSGSKGKTIGSPKAGLVLGPFHATELFLNFGEGFQSSDARGTVARLDPHSGTPFGHEGQVLQTPLLVKTRGAEAGVRTRAIDGLDTSLTFFWQDFDAENLFHGDTGTTEFGRPSRRLGFEWTGNYSPNSWVRFDGVVSATHARFRGSDLVQTAIHRAILSGGAEEDALFPLNVRGNSPGNFLINAPTVVATGGVELGEKTGWFGSLRYRYFGSRPLTEDGQIKSLSAGTLNARLGYRFDNGWKLIADAFNITNNRGDAVSYGYGSFVKSDLLFFGRPGHTEGIRDRHFKPVDPTAFRITISGPLSLDGPFTPRPF